MSFKLKYNPGGSPTQITARVPASTTILKDQLLMLDATNNGVIPATSSTVTTNLFAVAQEAVTTAGSAGAVRAIIVTRGQIWQGDCTNNTATDQLFKRHALTDGVAVNNSSSESTGTGGVVLMTKVVGAASNKKAEFLMCPTVVED